MHHHLEPSLDADIHGFVVGCFGLPGILLEGERVFPHLHVLKVLSHYY